MNFDPEQYAIVLEGGGDSWGAHVLDLPVFAAAATRQETEALVREAIVFHVEGLLEAGLPIPPPSS